VRLWGPKEAWVRAWRASRSRVWRDGRGPGPWRGRKERGSAPGPDAGPDEPGCAGGCEAEGGWPGLNGLLLAEEAGAGGGNQAVGWGAAAGAGAGEAPDLGEGDVANEGGWASRRAESGPGGFRAHPPEVGLEGV